MHASGNTDTRNFKGRRPQGRAEQLIGVRHEGK